MALSYTLHIACEYHANGGSAMKRGLIFLTKHAALIQILIVVAVIAAIALAGAAPNAFDP